MATTTKFEAKPSEPTPTRVDLDAHQAEMERRNRERYERYSREERIRDLDPFYAAQKQLKIPRFRYLVSVSWWAKDPADKYILFEIEKKVFAANDQEAWNAWCHAAATIIQSNRRAGKAYPNFIPGPQQCKTREIKKLSDKPVGIEEFVSPPKADEIATVKLTEQPVATTRL